MLRTFVSGVIFDMDGTLLDSNELHIASWQQALEKFGKHFNHEQIHRQIGQGGDNLLPSLLSKEEYAFMGNAIEEEKLNLYLKHGMINYARPFAMVPELLKSLQAEHIKIAIATSCKREELERCLQILNIRELVDVTVCADDVMESKPNPAVFFVAARRLNVPVSRIIVVGDTPYDVIAARLIGLPCIGVLSGGFSRDILQKVGAVAVYKDIADIYWN